MKKWFTSMLKQRAGEPGVAFVLVIILLLLAVILIPASLMFTGTGLGVNRVYEKNTKAYYAAEAGIEDSKWQVKYEKLNRTLLSNTPPQIYSPYDYSTIFGPYTLADDIGVRSINGYNVQVSVQNVWAPYGISPPDPNSGKVIIEGIPGKLPKVIITSNVFRAYENSNEPGVIEITVQYYPDAEDNLLIQTLGIWLPQGFTYHQGFTNNIDHTIYYPDSNNLGLPHTLTHLKGTAIFWNFIDTIGDNAVAGYPFVGIDANHPAFPKDTAGNPMNPSDPAPLVSKIYFSFDAPEAGANPQAVAWINTNTDLTSGGGVPYTYTWDSNIKLNHFVSEAIVPGSSPITVASKIETTNLIKEIRHMASGKEGDYYATGNTLMRDAHHDNYDIRDTWINTDGAAVNSSSNTVGQESSSGSGDGVPADGTVQAAYLYWTSWFMQQSAYQDTCNNFDEWSVSGRGGNSQTVVPDGDGDISGNWVAPPTSTTQTRVPTGNGDVSGTWNPIPSSAAVWDTVDETTPDDNNYVTISGAPTMTAGPNNAGIGANVTGIGTRAWTTPGNITAADTSYATASVSQNVVTNYLRGTGYNFNIPGTATINGITVFINRASSNNSSPRIRDNVVQLVKSGSIVGTNEAATTIDWPGNNSFAIATYGGTSDLWGTTWTPTDINNGNFGVVLSVTNTNSNSRTASVDYIQITVSYTTGASPDNYILFNYTAFIVPSNATITGLTLNLRAADVSSGTNNIIPRLKIGGVYYDGNSYNPPSTDFSYYSYTWTNNPANNSTWTFTDINNGITQFGLHTTDASPAINISMVYIQVNYTIPGGSLYPNVAKTTQDDNTYVTGTTDSGGYCLFTFPKFNVPTGATITNLTIYLRASDNGASGSGNIRERIKVNGNYYDGAIWHSPSGSGYTAYHYDWATNPNTNAAWTVADINNTAGAAHPLQEIGVYSNNLNPDIRLSMVYAEVDYTGGASLWSIASGQFHGRGNLSANDMQRTLEQNYYFNLGSAPSGTALSWQQTTSNNLSSSDYLRFNLYNDHGWSGDYYAFQGTNPTSPYIFNIPSGYLTSYFKVRFYISFTNSSQTVDIDNIQILIPDTQVYFKINGAQVSFDSSGNPQRGITGSNGSLTVDPLSNVNDLVWTRPNFVAAGGGYTYCCRKDVTALVQNYSSGADISDPHNPVYGNGSGTYTVGNVDGTLGIDSQSQAGYQLSHAGWSLVLVYTSPQTLGHQVFLYNKFAFANDNTNLDFDFNGTPGGDINGFLVPDRINGVVTAINVTNGGHGYTTTPTVNILGVGSEATALAILHDDTIQTILVTNGGSGYDSYTSVDISGGGGTGAAANATVESETYAGKMTAMVGEGDDFITGDYLALNGTKLWDGINSTSNSAGNPNNVWNGRSTLFPSSDGIDIDTFNVTWNSGLLHPGDTTAHIDMYTGQDNWDLIYIIVSFRSKITSGGNLDFLINP